MLYSVDRAGARHRFDRTEMRPMLARTGAPANDPISTADLKTHLRISHSAADTYLATLIATVIGECDGPAGYLRRALISQTWELKYPAFPGGWAPWRLPIPPLQSVSSITYYDENNTQQTLSTDVYSVHTPEGAAGWIERNTGQSYPGTYTRADAVTVTVVCGYGDDAADVPAQIRHGLKLLAASLYSNRGDMTTDRGIDPALLDRMLGPYRWLEVA